ncbi:MAG: 50S ribosomal protein L3 [Ignavibacteriae bacterium]|nr:50S ribosomal protein L3 [Ignavibacteriota bacterium]MCB9244374.1 50S ribosomal protein L3 [Ignavibacteriales bacterium]
MIGILGKKLGMTTYFTPEGDVISCTVVEAGPCVVTQIKTAEKDGYTAVQVGYGKKKEKRVKNPQKSVYKKLKIDAPSIVKEIRDYPVGDLKEGDEIKVSMFKEGDNVKVTGTSKAKGFQGVVKRHGFGGGVKTHGQSDRLRAPGSIGQSSYPSRVFKGMKMAGRMGGVQKTVRNLKVVKVIEDSNLILLSGPVPGVKSSVVEIYKN